MNGKIVLVCGAGGFIGSHLVKALSGLGHIVVGADIKLPDFSEHCASAFELIDLTDQKKVEGLFDKYNFEEVYQLAADMGGAEYIFSGLNDANVFYNSGQINFNIVSNCLRRSIKKVFYSSSACIYPEYRQESLDASLSEPMAYPAAPDSEYGWEKIMSERLYMAFERNYGIQVRIARFHNIYGPEGTWEGGKEKAPAATCRKVLEAVGNGTGIVEVYGDGLQTRSFLYIDECVEGILRLMESDYNQPMNIGSDYQISINDLTHMVSSIARTDVEIKNVPTSVQGVRGRNSDNTLIEQVLGWKPDTDLYVGMKNTFDWIKEQREKDNGLF